MRIRTFIPRHGDGSGVHLTLHPAMFPPHRIPVELADGVYEGKVVSTEETDAGFTLEIEVDDAVGEKVFPEPEPVSMSVVR